MVEVDSREIHRRSVACRFMMVTNAARITSCDGSKPCITLGLMRLCDVAHTHTYTPSPSLSLSLSLSPWESCYTATQIKSSILLSCRSRMSGLELRSLGSKASRGCMNACAEGVQRLEATSPFFPGEETDAVNPKGKETLKDARSHINPQLLEPYNPPKKTVGV